MENTKQKINLTDAIGFDEISLTLIYVQIFALSVYVYLGVITY